MLILVVRQRVSNCDYFDNPSKLQHENHNLLDKFKKNIKQIFN